MRLVKALSAAALLSSVLCAPALAATCNAPGGFDAFIAEFKKDAAAKGVSQKGLSALNGLTLDPSVLAADKRQGVFKQTFEEFSGRMISRDRMTKGLRLHADARARRSRRSKRSSACRARSSSRSGVSKPTSASAPARKK